MLSRVVWFVMFVLLTRLLTVVRYVRFVVRFVRFANDETSISYVSVVVPATFSQEHPHEPHMLCVLASAITPCGVSNLEQEQFAGPQNCLAVSTQPHPQSFPHGLWLIGVAIPAKLSETAQEQFAALDRCEITRVNKFESDES